MTTYNHLWIQVLQSNWTSCNNLKLLPGKVAVCGTLFFFLYLCAFQVPCFQSDVTNMPSTLLLLTKQVNASILKSILKIDIAEPGNTFRKDVCQNLMAK